MGSTRGTISATAAALDKIAAGIHELGVALDSDVIERIGTPAAMHDGAWPEDAASDPGDVSEAALCAQLERLVGLERRLSGVSARVLGRFHARGAGGHDGALSTAAWLRHRTDMAPGEATRRVRIARAVSALPEVGAAYTAGTLNSEKLLLLHASAEQVGPERFAPAEPLMVEQARSLTLPGLRHALTALRHTLDPDATDREHRARENDRELFLAQTLDGIWSLRGTLTPECGSALSAVLSSITPRPTPDDERTAPQRRHDAAHDLFRAVLDQGGLPAVGGEKPHIGVITHLTDITGPHDLTTRLGPPDLVRAVAPDPPGTGTPGPLDAAAPNARNGSTAGARTTPRLPAHLPRPGEGGILDGGGHLPSTALQRMSCDAQIYRIVFSPAGAIVDVGRKERTVPPWLRRALVARDGGCRFVGCDRPPPFCDAHHAVEWSRGGETSVRNCLLICRRHHRLIHDDGWRLTFDGTTVTVHRPDGTLLTPDGHAPPDR